MTTRRAVLLGGTGLIGGHVLALLAERPEYREVVVITRRPMPMPGDHCVNRVLPLSDIDSEAAVFHGADVFCCLGTTIKQAGSREAFRQVDFGFVLQAANLAANAGSSRFLVVSAVNANARAMGFYARVKGEMEAAVAGLSIPMVAFMQPSLLQGDREDFRLGEELGQRVLSVVRPFAEWSKAAWLPVDATTVAQAMVSVALTGPEQGVHRFRYRDMLEAARKLEPKE